MKNLVNKIKGFFFKKFILKKALANNKELENAIGNCSNQVNFDDAFAEFED